MTCPTCGDECKVLDRPDPLAPIREVYEQFRHMDRLLSDPAGVPDGPFGLTLLAMWRAIKAAVEAP